jgi:hypothetical protein
MSADRIPEDFGGIQLYVLKESLKPAIDLFNLTVKMAPGGMDRYCEIVGKQALPLADSHWVQALETAGIPGEIIFETYNAMLRVRNQNPATAESGF